MKPGDSPFKLSIITATHQRATALRDVALASLLQQTDLDFEWVVINDGKDTDTRNLIQSTELPFRHQYLEIDHPQAGFGLCIARNLGIETANGEHICYLDDDNSLRPDCTATLHTWFKQSPHSQFCLPQQWRRRDVIRNGQVVKQGKPFVSPSPETTLNDLITQQSLFDSNGFTHKRTGSPRWNPRYKIFCDYEFFLQCVSQCDHASEEQFFFIPEILVNYIQTTDGIIGQSGYGEWARELQQLYDQRLTYKGIKAEWANWMPQAIQKYQQKSQVPLPAFTR
ncbi:glycosyltransferase family A protein [Acaryochloris sp. IP29b_bin.148]|uniref:glycosyltransferase family 2 protein n=1 Tax=Acaryochloris sp. IP29b_bin.148 TaxID=2969218 RepID=UPI0026190686|nr:glycosyltransferase family A protein [Acaryochloris sp. IP29b_bin.148]